jgi:hypothetical protein
MINSLDSFVLEYEDVRNGWKLRRMFLPRPKRLAPLQLWYKRIVKQFKENQ